MKRLLLLLLLPGCTALDFDGFSVPDMLTRSMNPNVLYNGTDTGYRASRGLTTADIHVYSMVMDANLLARGMIAKYNGETNAAAMIQTALGGATAITAMAGGPVGLAGGFGLASVLAGRIFTNINSPAQSNAFGQFVERNTDLLNLYRQELKAETGCSFISGQSQTNASINLEVGFDLSLVTLEKVRRGILPTLEQLQGSTVSPSARSNARAFMSLGEAARSAPCPAQATIQ